MAMEDAAQRGFEFKFTWLDPPTAYEEVWQHPAAAAHNARLDRRTAEILDTFLFALYELRAECDHGRGPPYILVVGHVGNTGNYEIWRGTPDTPPAVCATPPRSLAAPLARKKTKDEGNGTERPSGTLLTSPLDPQPGR